MKDFRPEVVHRAPSRKDVEDLLKKGLIAKAIRKAKKASIAITQEQIDAASKFMYLHGRAGELLSLIGSVDVRLPYDPLTLLVRAFDSHDYHTFLKQAHRLGITEGLTDRICTAIADIETRAPREAESWRLKF
jgi:hypothetical protein